MKKLTNFFLSLVLAVTAFTFFAPTAPAFADDCPIQDATREIPAQFLETGSFDTSKYNLPPLKVDCTEIVRSVIVTLEPSTTTDPASGIIDEIKITREDVKGQEIIEFGCSNIKVKNGDDLTLICGGTAVLEPGPTTYFAKGYDFGTESGGRITKFAVTLSGDFSDQYKTIYGTEEDKTVKSVLDLYGLTIWVTRFIDKYFVNFFSFPS